MRFLRFLLIAALLCAPAGRLGAADAKWVHASSAHFEMYAAQSESDVRAALRHLEIVRAFFLRSTHSQDPGGQPVRVVVFQSEGDSAKYRPLEYGIVGTYSLAGTPATIVTLGLKPESYEYIFREYCQLVLDQSAPKIPYWLRAGLAQFYSTLKPEDNKVKLGSAPRRAFHSHDALNLDLIQLFGADRAMFLESGSRSAKEFYADTGSYAALGARGAAATQALNALEAKAAQDYELPSWALTHMLMFNPTYRGKVGDFIGALSNGQETVAGFGSVYGRSLADVRSDLTLYMQQAGLAVAEPAFQYEKPPAPVMKPATKDEVETLLASTRK